MIFAGFLLGMFEATLSTFLHGYTSFILPVIPFIVLLIVRDRPTHALIAAGSAGLVMDIFALGHPTFAIARLLIIALLIIFLARTFLTNQSLYAAVALTIIARTIDRSWLMIVYWIRGSLPFIQMVHLSWPSAWRIAISDIIFVTVIFIFLTFLTQKFVIRRSQTQTQTYV